MKKNADYLTVFLCGGILFSLAIAFWILPDRVFSETENRSLQPLPKCSWDAFYAGDLSQNVNAYFEDQFPLRDLFVGIKADCELLFGKGENNGVLLGENGQTARRLFAAVSESGMPYSAEIDTFDEDLIRAAAEGISHLQQNTDLPVTVVLPGRNIDVAASAFAYPNTESERLLSLLQSFPGYCDVNAPLKSAYENGEYVTYKTDHHWTTYGAYLAYCEILRSFGMEDAILAPSDFEIETASESFFGTSQSASGFVFLSPDTVEFWHAEDENDFFITADGKQSDGFYTRSYLEKKDQYGAFLDGTHDVVTVEKVGEERPTLLLAKDSFANCLAPFLAEHFNLVILNLSSTRKDYTNLSELAEEYGASRILIVYNLENVVTGNKLTKMR